MTSTDAPLADRRSGTTRFGKPGALTKDCSPPTGAFKTRIRTANVGERDSLDLGQHRVPPGEYVLIQVGDTGHGIPTDILDRIFERFYTDRPESSFGSNSGLGLSISKQIVEAHGGVIWAENIRPTNADITSEPLGARFVVGLPV